MSELFCFLLVWTNPERLPPLCDLERFPNQQAVDKAVDSSLKVDEWIAANCRVGLWDFRQTAVAREAQEFCWRPWKQLEEAHSWQNTKLERRHHLARLRELLGSYAYAQGRMGCPVAWELFPERD